MGGITPHQIQQFFATSPTPQAAAEAIRAHNISADQIASAMKVGVPDVNQYFTKAGITDIYNPPVNTGVNVPNNPRGADPTGGTSSHPETNQQGYQGSFEDWATQRGYRYNEDNGNWYAPDDGGTINPRDDSGGFAAMQRAYAIDRSGIYGSGGAPVGMNPTIIRDGKTFTQIGGFANNSDDPQVAIQSEIEYLRGYGVNPVYDPQHGWIAEQNAAFDQAHDPNYYSKHEDWLSKLGTLGPILLPSILTGSGALTGLDSMAGGAAAASTTAGALPESYWSTLADASGSNAAAAGTIGLDAAGGLSAAEFAAADAAQLAAQGIGQNQIAQMLVMQHGMDTMLAADIAQLALQGLNPTQIAQTVMAPGGTGGVAAPVSGALPVATPGGVTAPNSLGIPFGETLTPAPVQSGPTTVGPGPGGSQPPVVNPADVTKAGGLTNSITKLFDGTADSSDLLKLGLTAAGAAALLGDNPDRTTTTKVEYPDWYNKGSQSALSLADKYAALGPNSVAPLSANENAASTMASTYAGKWLPTLEKANSTIDSAQTAFGKAGALADSVPGYLDRATGQVDASMPYFGKADTMADTVSGYLNKSGALADEAAGGIPSINLSDYMNPYLDNVLTPIARRNELAKAAALNDINARAGMRGAFGGSRNDLLTNLTSESADRNLNEAEANIRSGAFTTGLSTAQADLNRKLAASGQYGALGTTAGNTAGVYNTIGKSVADTAGQFNNMGVVATGAANANTNIGRSLTDAAGGYRANAGTYGALTSTDIENLRGTGATTRGIEQAKLNAPLTAITGYANALRGTPGSTTTAVAPEASKIGQATGALAALLGANKAGWI